MDINEMKKLMQELVASSSEPKIPDVLNDERLEDAWKTPQCDAEGYAETLPCVWDSSSYGLTDEGVKILSLKSARTASNLYSRYLDEAAIVWDAAKQELFLYYPDPKYPAVAFKGGNWLCAKRLKMQYCYMTLHDVCVDLNAKLKESK